jgi:hypothetical protein
MIAGTIFTAGAKPLNIDRNFDVDKAVEQHLLEEAGLKQKAHETSVKISNESTLEAIDSLVEKDEIPSGFKHPKSQLFRKWI